MKQKTSTFKMMGALLAMLFVCVSACALFAGNSLTTNAETPLPFYGWVVDGTTVAPTQTEPDGSYKFDIKDKGAPSVDGIKYKIDTATRSVKFRAKIGTPGSFSVGIVGSGANADYFLINNSLGTLLANANGAGYGWDGSANFTGDGKYHLYELVFEENTGYLKVDGRNLNPLNPMRFGYSSLGDTGYVRIVGWDLANTIYLANPNAFIIEKNNLSYIKNFSESLEVLLKNDNNAITVKNGSVAVDATNYTYAAGKITFSKAYLDTFADGNHELILSCGEGNNATLNFKVASLFNLGEKIEAENAQVIVAPAASFQPNDATNGIAGESLDGFTAESKYDFYFNNTGAAGAYKLVFAYSNFLGPANGKTWANLSISVNDKIAILSLPGTGGASNVWNIVKEWTTMVDLTTGVNKISFSKMNDAIHAVRFDYLKIETAQTAIGNYEAEHATYSEGCYANGGLLSANNAADVGAHVEFNIVANAAKNYLLKVVYVQGDPRNVKLKINNGEEFSKLFPATGSWDVGTLTVLDTAIVALNSGANKIKFSGTGAFPFNIDRIEITEVPNYTVTYSDTTIAPAQVLGGTKISKPTDPTKSGFIFDNWYSDATLENLFDFDNYLIMGNITIYPKWNAKSLTFATSILDDFTTSTAYTSTFTGATVVDYAEATFTYALKEGSLLPAGLTLTGNTISGTSTATIGATFAIVATCVETTKTAEATFTIKATQAAPSAAPSATVPNIGSTAITLTSLGDNFEYAKGNGNGEIIADSWQVSLEFTGLTKNTAYTFFARLKGSDYLSASPASVASAVVTTLNNFSVTFDKGVATSENIPVQNIVAGNRATEPTAPTKNGYTFVGWYNGETLFSFDTIITADTTLTARFSIIEKAINYELDGGINDSTNPSSYTMESSIITLMPATKAGYTFSGWYSEATFATKVDEILPGTTDITLYAKFTINTYKITFATNGGSAINQIDATYKTVVAKPKDPTKAGYVFAGWYTNSDLTSEFNFAAKIEGDMTIYAKWTVATVPGTEDPATGCGSITFTDSNNIFALLTILGIGLFLVCKKKKQVNK